MKQSLFVLTVVCIFISTTMSAQDYCFSRGRSIFGMSMEDIPVSARNLVHDDENVNCSTTLNMDLSLEYDRLIVPGRKWNISLVPGIGVSLLTVKNRYNVPDYYVNDTGYDGSAYIRDYRNLSLDQETSIDAVNVSLFVRSRYSLFNNFNICGDLGVRCMLWPASDVEEMNGSAFVMGYDNQYNELPYDSKEWSMNNYGQTSFEVVNKHTDISFHSIIPTGMARFGVEYYSRVFACAAGFTYRHSFQDIIKYDCGGDHQNPDKALVYNEHLNGIPMENVRSIMNCYKKSRLDGFGVYLQIQYLFNFY